MKAVEYPSYRNEIRSVLDSLSDSLRQASWVPRDEIQYFEMPLIIHILYDDIGVLPEPQASMGDVLYEVEIPIFEQLESVLDPMIDDLGRVPDIHYLNHPNWATVMRIAREALAAMKEQDALRLTEADG